VDYTRLRHGLPKGSDLLQLSPALKFLGTLDAPTQSITVAYALAPVRPWPSSSGVARRMSL